MIEKYLWRYEDSGGLTCEVRASTRSEARARVEQHFGWKALPRESHFSLKRL